MKEILETLSARLEHIGTCGMSAFVALTSHHVLEATLGGIVTIAIILAIAIEIAEKMEG